MKRALLFCLLLCASLLRLDAQVKGYWVLAKEFVTTEDNTKNAYFQVPKITLRSYSPGHATFVGEYSVSTGTSSYDMKSQKYTPEFEIEWKLNRPTEMYPGEKNKIFATYTIRKDGQKFTNPFSWTKTEGVVINGITIPAGLIHPANYKISTELGVEWMGGMTVNGEPFTAEDILKLIDKMGDDFTSLESVFDSLEDEDLDAETGDGASTSNEGAIDGTLRLDDDVDIPPSKDTPPGSFMIIGYDVTIRSEGGYTGAATPVNNVGSISVHHGLMYKFVASDNISVTQEALEEAGEDEGTDIPWWVVIGTGGAIGGIGLGSILKKGGKKGSKGTKDQKKEEKKQEEKEEKEEKKEPSKFKMYLAKEFGNTLKVGEAPSTVGVRIEEITAKGQRIKRPDLTERIEIYEGENISVKSSYYRGDYLFAEIEANPPEGVKQCKGTITFTFVGQGGRLQNNIVFNIVNDIQEIIFQQNNFTFIAGKKAEYNMAFRVMGFSGDERDLSFTTEIEDGGGSRFELSEVRPDEAGMWCFDIKDTVEDGDGQPGRVDTYKCKVTVKKMDQKTGQERSMEGFFYLCRFYEGLRLTVGHIRAYPVVKGTGGVKEREVLPKTYEEEMEVPRTGVWVTLYAYDEKANELRSPATRNVHFRIEDVPDSVKFYGKKGEEITEPVKVMGFEFDTDNASISGNMNTFFCDFAPTVCLSPPSRAKAKVTCEVTFNGKDYSASRTVMVNSQPLRESDISKLTQYAKEDEKITNDLSHMRMVLLNKDCAAQMRPLIHKLGLLMDFYDPKFGYYMPEYHYLRNMFMRFTNGEIGPFYVNEHVYNGTEVLWGDAFDATIEDCSKVFPDSFMGRIMTDVLTLGVAEYVYYTPKDFLVECRKVANDGKDRGFWGNFAVGAVYGAREYLTACAFQGLVQKGFNSKVGKALQEEYKMFELAAKDVTKELAASSSKFAKCYRAASAIKKVANMKIQFKGKAKASLEIGRQKLANSPELEKLRKANEIAKLEGKAKAEKFIEKCKKANCTNEELMEAMLAVDTDRYAKSYMNTKAVPDKYRWRLTTERGIAVGHTELKVKKVLAEKYHCHESEITFFKATGNKSSSACNCKQVGMDLDYTPRVRGKDIPEAEAARIWNDAYYETVKGAKAPNMADADALAHASEHTAVNKYGLDSFGNDVNKIINKDLAHTKFENAQKVSDTQIYKVQEHLREGEDLMRKAMCCDDPKMAEDYIKKAIACYKEGARQFPKGMSRTIDTKLEAVIARGKEKGLNMKMVEDAMHNRNIIEEALERDAGGDSSAIIEMMAYFESDGRSLSDAADRAFSIIPALNNFL